MRRALPILLMISCAGCGTPEQNGNIVYPLAAAAVAALVVVGAVQNKPVPAPSGDVPVSGQRSTTPVAPNSIPAPATPLAPMVTFSQPDFSVQYPAFGPLDDLTVDKASAGFRLIMQFADGSLSISSDTKYKSLNTALSGELSDPTFSNATYRRATVDGSDAYQIFGFGTPANGKSSYGTWIITNHNGIGYVILFVLNPGASASRVSVASDVVVNVASTWKWK